MSSVLFVCLGNICRSPVAEGLAHLYNRQDDLFSLIESAGTSGFHIDEPPHLTMRKVSKVKGVDISNQQSRQVSLLDFEKFEYIVAMDTSNFDDLNHLKPIGSTASVVRLLDYSKSCLQDVPDPYYGGPQGFETCFDIIAEGMDGFFNAVKIAEAGK